ncbi:hypothetical protein [Gluconobacter cerinus]|uniref:hypothetical protein n=1 Tax=Gluconobacter cerinus TaxID=38307 RepID=UPI001B8C1D52|nr:hypothetical protein [Gluconobacter cerinus]MBS1070091.1 hypothetical protein [Gluconobacter cerinus]
MKNSMYSIYTFESYHGKEVFADPTTGRIMQGEGQEYPLILIELHNFPNTGIIFSPDPSIKDLSFPNSEVIPNFIPVNLQPYEELGVCAFQEIRTGNYLRAVNSNNTVDNSAAENRNWEKFSLYRKKENFINAENKIISIINKIIEDYTGCIEIINSLNDIKLLKNIFNVIIKNTICLNEIIENKEKINDQKKYKLLNEMSNENIFFKSYNEFKNKNAISAFINSSFGVKNNVIKEIFGAYNKDIPISFSTLESGSNILFFDNKNNQSGLSFLSFPAGLVSGDNSCVLGKDGHVFLTEGSNRLRELCLMDNNAPEAHDISEKWLGLIRERKEKILRRGSKFIQLIVPEKVSAMPDYFVGDFFGPTAYLKNIEYNEIYEYISCLGIFSTINTHDAYKKVDTHLQPLGAFAIFNAISEKFFGQTFPTPQFSRQRISGGDLSYRFFGHGVREVIYETEMSEETRFRKLVENILPRPGAHNGQRNVWRNSQAPLDLKVVAFGNSFFGSGLDQCCLGWWFSHFCKEFHHFWSPEIDYDYLDAVNPDFVICQTAERFLGRVPQA